MPHPIRRPALQAPGGQHFHPTAGKLASIARRLLVGSLLLAGGLLSVGFGAKPVAAGGMPVGPGLDNDSATPTSTMATRPTAAMDRMAGMNMDHVPPPLIATPTAHPMAGMNMDHVPPPLVATPTAHPMAGMSTDGTSMAPAGGVADAHGADSHKTGMSDDHEGAGTSSHMDSQAEAAAPDEGTKTTILGTLGLINAGVIMTAAVLKRRQPKKAAKRPGPSPSSVGDPHA